MKKYTDLILVACVILIGAFFFMKNYRKDVPKTVLAEPMIETENSTAQASTTDNIKHLLKNYSMFTTSREKVVLKKEDQVLIDGTFKSAGFTVTPEIFSAKISMKKNALKAQSWLYDMGATNIQYYGNLIEEGVKLNPIFIYDANSKCTMMVDIITKKNTAIKSVKDLAGKNIALVQRESIAAYTIVNAKVKAKKAYIGSVPEWAEQSLDSGAIDAALVTYRFTPGSNRIDSKMFRFPLAKYSQLKVAVAEDTMIPCDLVYLSEDLSPNEQKEIAAGIKKISVLDTDESRKVLNLIGAHPPLKEVSEDIKAKINSVYGNSTVYAEETIDQRKK